MRLNPGNPVSSVADTVELDRVRSFCLFSHAAEINTSATKRGKDIFAPFRWYQIDVLGQAEIGRGLT